jgi:ElaB/YqjD/DUF883 family membrane-anchored ribosome-binding protein
MNSHPPSGSTGRPAAVHGSKPSTAPAESSSAHGEFEHGQSSGVSDAMNQLSRDVANLRDTFAQLAAQVSNVGTKTVRDVSQSVASQIGSATSGMLDTGSDLASSAKEQAKTFASELESMARRNPLGTIAGALLVGVIIGMMSRGRS